MSYSSNKLENPSPQINIKRQSPTGTDEISSFPNQVNGTSFPNEGLRRSKRVCAYELMKVKDFKAIK